MLKILVVALSILTAFCGDRLSAEESSRIVFPNGGFSIAPLEPTDPQSSYQATIMFLETTEGFAPNLNVQIQRFADSIEAYEKLTLGQIEAANYELLGVEALDPSTVSFEYTGTMQGRSLHWYARAIKRGERVYLATATCKETQWKTVSLQLIRAVDSFRLE